MDGPFTFETLSNQEALEKKSRTLTKIEPSFFRYVANYLDSLDASYRKEHAQNSSSKKATFLIDELRNAQNKADELWKAREKKIVQFAMVNARKDPLPPAPDHLTREESEFYHTLVNTFRAQIMRLLPQRTATAYSPSAVSVPHPPRVAPPQIPMAATTGGASVSAPPPPPPPSPSSTSVASSPPSPPAKDEVQTIRALVDIPPFVGFDGKTYRIKKGDVLSLPKKFAAILKDRNQAALVG